MLRPASWLLSPWLLAIVPALRFSEGKDILCLKDGRVVQGPPMERLEGGIEIAYPHGKVLVSHDLILDAVLNADAHAPPLTEEEKVQAEKGFVRFENKWVTPQQRESIVAKRVEKRRTQLEEAKAHGEWRNRYIEEGKYFHFEYTVPKHLFEPYRDAMEAYFADFARTWKIQPLKGGFRLPVCFHIDRKAFQQISGMPRGVLGYFDPTRKDLNIFYERLDPEQSEDTMFHEANHYLQYLLEPRFWVPHFPGESLAEYYGASKWDPVNKKLTVGLIQEGRLCEIQTDIAAGERVDLTTLITTKDQAGQYQHYTWGWSLVHFLMNDPRYTAKFQRFFTSLPDTKGAEKISVNAGVFYTISEEDVLAAFVRELGLKNADGIRKLDVEWHAYVDSKLQLVSTAGLEKAGMKAKSVGRQIRATRLLKEAIAKGSRNPLVYHSLADIYAEDGKRGEAMEMWKKALEFDPLNGAIYARMAFYLPESDKAERQRLQALAAELGSDDLFTHLDLDSLEKPPEDPGKKPGGEGPGGKKPPGGG